MPALTWTRRGLVVAQLLLLAVTRQASADTVQQCIDQHAEAQRLRKQGRLLESRERLRQCAQASCPALVSAECRVLELEVEAAQPSIVLEALDARGQPTRAPVVSIDGSTRSIPLDGRPVPLDPGEHTLRFQLPDGEVRALTVSLAESTRELPVRADFRPLPGQEPALEAPQWPNSVLLASVGVGAVALGSFTYFALSGRAIQDDLERCRPDCEDRDEADRMRSRYLLADVSLGVALVSVAVGAYAWTQRGPSASTSSARTGGVRLHALAGEGKVGLSATGEF